MIICMYRREPQTWYVKTSAAKSNGTSNAKESVAQLALLMSAGAGTWYGFPVLVGVGARLLVDAEAAVQSEPQKYESICAAVGAGETSGAGVPKRGAVEAA